MEYQTILLSCQDKIGILTLNTPENMNAISQKLVEELKSAIQEIKANENCRVVIITGAGKSFIGGADIKFMQGLNPLQGAQFCYALSKTTLEMDRMNQVFIAAVNGYALGAGFEVALGCDLRIFSTDAKVGLPETGQGVIPGAGGVQRLQRLIGVGKANEFVFTGDIIGSEEALSLGIANKLTSPEKLMDTALEMASKILSKSSTATSLAKQAMQMGRDMDLEKAIEYDKNLFGLCFASAEQKEGMTAFIEKRKPIY